MLMNPCSMFRSFFITIMSYCTILSWSWQFCLLSASLWFHCLHILYCYLFLATGLCADPALISSVYIFRIGCTDYFSSFNIIGYSSPLLPCRQADLRRGLIYSENLQHSPCSLPTPHNFSDCTSMPDSPFHRLECSLRLTSSSRNARVRATLPPSTLFADRVLLRREYSISVPKACGETISEPLGLTLGQVYNPSRLQLTRQRFNLNHKAGDPQTICRPWWALQVIKRRVGCRSVVWIVTLSGKRARWGAEGSRCRWDLLGLLVCKAVGERSIQQY